MAYLLVDLNSREPLDMSREPIDEATVWADDVGAAADSIQITASDTWAALCEHVTDDEPVVLVADGDDPSLWLRIELA